MVVLDNNILLPCVKEVITRYDTNKDGLLSPKEAFCFLQAFWGPGHSTGHVQVFKKLYTDPRYEARNVEQEPRGTTMNYIGDIPLSGMLNYCKDELEKSEDRRIQAQSSLISHGYEMDENKKELKLGITNPPLETYQTLCKYLAELQLKYPVNVQLMQLSMEVSNNMIEFRERPNEEAMKLLVQRQGHKYTVSFWDNREAGWELEKKVAQVQALDQSGKWNPNLITAFKEIITRYDGDGDGKLKESELRLLFGVLYERLPRQHELERFDPTLDSMWDEVDEDNYIKGLPIKFVLWHGYNTELRLPKAFNKEALTVKSLIAKIQRDVELKGGKGIGFEIELLGDILEFNLDRDEQEGMQLSESQLQVMGEILDLPDLLDLFRLRRGKFKQIRNAEEALDLLILAFRYKTLNLFATSPSFQRNHLMNAGEAILDYAKQHADTFADFFFTKDVVERLAGVQNVTDHLARRSCRVSGGRPQSIIPYLLGSFIVEETQGSPFEQLWKLFDPVRVITFVIQLIQAGALDSSGIIVSLLKPFAESEVIKILDQVVNQKLLAKEFTDFLFCDLYGKPYPPILSKEAELCQMTADDINKAIAEYCGISPEKIDEFFIRNDFIGPGQSIGKVILGDAKSLQDLKADRNDLATRFTAALDYGHVLKLQHDLKGMKQRGQVDQVYEKDVQDRIQQITEDARPHLGVDISNLPEDFPLRVAKCYTMGHQGDLFHPSNASSSYYMKGDIVGGSADCLIINTKLLSEEHKDTVSKWTHEDMQKLLEDRLNAPEKADWEDWGGVLYCSDMNPYLIRIACFFEGPGTRYRVDPEKLYRILEI